MLKYIKQHMASITDIEIYPLISFVIFFTFFSVVTYLVITAKKNEMDKMANIPFDNQ